MFQASCSDSGINFDREMCQCHPKIPMNMIDLNFYFDQTGQRLKHIDPVNVSEIFRDWLGKNKKTKDPRPYLK